MPYRPRWRDAGRNAVLPGKRDLQALLRDAFRYFQAVAAISDGGLAVRVDHGALLGDAIDLEGLHRFACPVLLDRPRRQLARRAARCFRRRNVASASASFIAARCASQSNHASGLSRGKFALPLCLVAFMDGLQVLPKCGPCLVVQDTFGQPVAIKPADEAAPDPRNVFGGVDLAVL